MSDVIISDWIETKRDAIATFFRTGVDLHPCTITLFDPFIGPTTTFFDAIATQINASIQVKILREVNPFIAT